MISIQNHWLSNTILNCSTLQIDESLSEMDVRNIARFIEPCYI